MCVEEDKRGVGGEKLREGYHLKSLGVGGIMILKWILKKWDRGNSLD